MAPTSRTGTWNAGYRAGSEDACAVLRDEAHRIEIAHMKVFPGKPCSASAALLAAEEIIQRLAKRRSET